MRITGLHQKAPKGEKRKKSSLELGRPCPILILTVCNLTRLKMSLCWKSCIILILNTSNSRSLTISLCSFLYFNKRRYVMARVKVFQLRRFAPLSFSFLGNGLGHYFRTHFLCYGIRNLFKKSKIHAIISI